MSKKPSYSITKVFKECFGCRSIKDLCEFMFNGKDVMNPGHRMDTCRTCSSKIRVQAEREFIRKSEWECQFCQTKFNSKLALNCKNCGMPS